MAQPKSRAWCITHHYDPADHPEYEDGAGEYTSPGDFWQSLVSTHGARYACAQREIAPTTLKRHYQGYVYFSQPRRRESLRLLFHSWCGVSPHLEISKGTPAQNKAYCSKPESALPGTFNEWGEMPMQGKRGDLDDIAELTKTESLTAIADAFPSQFIRYHRGIQTLQRLHHSHQRTPSDEVTVEWWFGPTGTGKSRDAFTLYPTAYVKMNNKWWDGYLGESVVILDDYRPSLCTFQEFLRLLDRYPMRVEVKGDSMPLSTTHFVITTTKRPEIIWQGRTEEALNQLLRRLTIIKEYTPEGVTVLKDATTVYVAVEPAPVADNFYLPAMRERRIV